MQDSIEQLRQDVRARPFDVAALYNLGLGLVCANRYTEAIPWLYRALKLWPDNARIHNTLGYLLNKQGRNTEALERLREAIRLDPGYIDAHDNLIYYLHYDFDGSPALLREAHDDWNRLFTGDIQQPLQYQNTPDPERVLRVGYVSADFREHSVARFLEPLLTNHNPDRVAVYCYANMQLCDQFTRRFMHMATVWHEVNSFNDDQLAELIRSDGIDILVDLAGHTAGNRLPVFARKPAPLQLTWLGYPDTTGLDQIDYRLTDTWADPPGTTEHLHSEKLLRLVNGFLCYQPPEDSEPVSTLPMLKSGHVTFGSFNALPKVTPCVIETWCELLKLIPGARLIMKNKSFRDEGTRSLIQKRFADHGIDISRIELLGWLPGVNAHMALYNRIDIALDTFPYNGTTTTCEALWMGVPVLTMCGTTHVERVSASLLERLDMQGWITNSLQSYVSRACELASQPEQLASIREQLRTRMQQSSLCDAGGFARDVEHTYREIWRYWCDTQSTSQLTS